MPSLTRLSARSTVTVRRGRSRARTPTAVASVGASAAPSTQAGPHCQAERVRRRRDRGGGGDDQDGAGEDDDPQVVADLAQRGGQALPVEQRRQEEQEHDLRRQLRVAQLRHEPDQHADQHQQDRRRDRVAARERAAHDQGDPEQHHHLESEHGPILAVRFLRLVSPGRCTVAPGSARACSATAAATAAVTSGSKTLGMMKLAFSWSSRTTAASASAAASSIPSLISVARASSRPRNTPGTPARC